MPKSSTKRSSAARESKLKNHKRLDLYLPHDLHTKLRILQVSNGHPSLQSQVVALLLENLDASQTRASGSTTTPLEHTS